MSNQIAPFQFLIFRTTAIASAIALLSLASPSGTFAADPPVPAPESTLAQAVRANSESYLAQRQFQAIQDRKRTQDAEAALKAPAPAVQLAPPPQPTTASAPPLPSPTDCPRPPGLPFWAGGGRDTADLAYGNGRRLTVRVNDVLAGGTSAGLTVKSVWPGGSVVTRAGCDYALLPIAAIPRPLM
jgi:hypothetical protein